MRVDSDSDEPQIPVVALHPGEVLRASVLALKPGGDVILGMLGTQVRVRSELPLEVGDEITVVVETRPGSTQVRLRVVGPDEQRPGEGELLDVRV